jgi:NAD-dependent dihydropyrimidine dehydrogenase PreA subunit
MLKGQIIGVDLDEAIDCAFCKSQVGKDIGGHFVGYHWKTPVAICEWCQMCLEDVL